MKKHKIAILTNLNSNTDAILRNAVNLAKRIDGEIEVFHTSKPTYFVKNDNQLSALRSLASENRRIDKKLKNLITPIAAEHKVKINYSYAFGNIKGEINKFIKVHNPDILVLGKKQHKPFRVFRNMGVSDFVIKNFDGAIYIATDNNAVLPEEEISLGILNAKESNLDFSENGSWQTKKPIKNFKLVEKVATVGEHGQSEDSKSVEYVFEHSDNSVKNLSKYISDSKVDLLLVEREKIPNNKGYHLESDLKSVINRLNLPLLVMGEQKYNFTKV